MERKKAAPRSPSKRTPKASSSADRTAASERWRVARCLHPGQAVAGVGGQQPGQVTGFRQLGPVGQGAAQVLGQRRPDAVGEGAGVLQLGLEVGGGVGQPEGLQLGRVALGILAQQHKVAGVGDQHETVALPVAADLSAVGGEPGVVASWLDLDHAGLRRLSLLRLSLLYLPGGVEAEVGMSRALLGQLADTIHPGPQRAAHRVQQVSQRQVIGQLAGAAARSADTAQLDEVLLNRRRQFSSGCRHFPVYVSFVCDLRLTTGAGTPARPASPECPCPGHQRPLSRS